MLLPKHHFYFIAANVDYIPILENLTFALVTNNTQCVSIPILNDPFIEDDEVFFLQSIDTNLTETTPQTVTITITNDNSNKSITVLSDSVIYYYFFLCFQLPCSGFYNRRTLLVKISQPSASA